MSFSTPLRFRMTNPARAAEAHAEQTKVTREGEAVLSVAELNKAVRAELERGWADVWVHGEISDWTLAASGHAYFTLSDPMEPAQLRCVMFRGDLRKCASALKEGEIVKVRGTLSLYQARGSFQMIARDAEAFGEGDLRAQFEKLKAKLTEEGLTDATRKRPLPKYPRKIGVVTSRSGAALQDIIRVAERRSPVHIVVSHCLVQGAEAPASILEALKRIQEVPDIEVVIIGRGGGAAEDLFAFNDEAVARAIANCRVPVVSAVGHEIDVTIADFVADLRAATPSQAAEQVVPERSVLLGALAAQRRALEQAMALVIGRERVRLERASRSLKQPAQALHANRVGLLRHTESLQRNQLRGMRFRRDRLRALERTILEHNPQTILAKRRHTLSAFEQALLQRTKELLVSNRHRVQKNMSALNALSPLGVLERGYALVFADAGTLLRDAYTVTAGTSIEVKLHQGALKATVTNIIDPQRPPSE